MSITEETRREAHDNVDKKQRYSQIIEILDGKQLTAKEIAVEMYRRGLTPTSERNFSSPRLTELVNKGIVEAIGKKVCTYTGRKVAVFRLKEVKE